MASRAELKKFVYKSKSMTFNDLKKLVEGIQNLDIKSKVNPAISRKFVIDEIFNPFFKDLEKKCVDFNAPIKTTMFNDLNRLTLTPYGMIMLNILHECDYSLK